MTGGRPPSLHPAFLPTLSQKVQDAHSKRMRAREALRGLKGGLGGGGRGGREADRIIVRSGRAADRDARARVRARRARARVGGWGFMSGFAGLELVLQRRDKRIDR